MPLNPWGGPPTSGNSTPLRENIPESPTDGFPDFGHLPTPESLLQPRRARAGTVPSRFPGGGPGTGHLAPPGLGAQSARNTPSQTPYNKSPSPGLELNDAPSGGSALLSRLRAGSMPQRSQFAPVPPGSSPFGPSIFSSWNPSHVGRERGSTLASIASVPSNGPSSPSQSQFSREGGNESDVHMRTLDYLGLAGTPQPPRASMATMAQPSLNFLKQANRIRSYSVNNKDVHADEYPEDGYETDTLGMDGPQYVSQMHDKLAQEVAANNAAIRYHNLQVQALNDQRSATRRRAHTTNVLDRPGAHLMTHYFANEMPTIPSLGGSSLRMQEEHNDLPQAVANMSLHRSNSHNNGLLGVNEGGLEGPTNALWLGNVPLSTTNTTLAEMFKIHGPVKSARVLTNKNCGFVNFENVESAIAAKAAMNGKEIFPGASPVRINFAKPPSPSATPGHDGVYPSPSPDPLQGRTSSQVNAGATAEASSLALPSDEVPTPPGLQNIANDILEMIKDLGATDEGVARSSEVLEKAMAYNDYIDEIPPVREATQARVHDAPKLRELRKRIDNQSLTVSEIEEAAIEMLPEVAELSSDYLGNTVVQKLFDHCSDNVKDQMLAQIAPHLAVVGCHKNGTWAAQKIIDVCKSAHQMATITENIHPYTLPLFLDQFGNYVVQGCLKFGTPYTEFIFETMMARMAELSSARFGARAMRACLESHHATKDQQRLLAAQIAIHSVHLATDQNGALLLTWYLDTCTLPQRRTVLAPRLVPYLVHLCTHKVAYLTVLKVVNQKAEPQARDTMLEAIFFNEPVLEAILRDSNYGATLIFKVLTTPFFNEEYRVRCTESIKTTLVRIKAQSNQGYKRLMDEVGLSTRTGPGSRDSSAHNEQRQRPNSRHTNSNGHHAAQGGGKGQYYGGQGPHGSYDGGFGPQRSDMGEPMAGYPQMHQSMMPTGNGGMPPGMMPYQQNILGRGGPAMNYGYQTTPGGYGGYANGPMAMPPGGPMNQSVPQIPQGPAAGNYASPPPVFGLPMGAGYGYGNAGGMPNVGGYSQQVQGGRRNQR